MSNDNQDQFREKQEAWSKLTELISYSYKRHSTQLSDAERHMIEEFLDNREYELALTELVAVLRNHNIAIDTETAEKLTEACDRMKISLPEYLKG